ncbi:MAG: hypothetical protein QM695_15875 [Micropruina sp.]
MIATVPSEWAATISGVAPVVSGLDADHQAALSRLTAKIATRRARNRLRRRYYDYEQGLKDLQISLPPDMAVTTVLGWPAKAVNSMVRRTVLDTWTLPEGTSSADIGLDAIIEDNRLDSELPSALTSSLLHGVAFGFATAGGVGEAPAILSFKSAEWASGTWDPRRRQLSEALSIVATDLMGTPTQMALYLPGLVIDLHRDGDRWELFQFEHDLGIPVEPIPYRVALDRPFGSSRISRPVMELTDAAVRTFVRTEVAAEFYNAPQRYALGAGEKAFKDPVTGEPLTGWQVILGHLLTLDRDADGNLPTVGEFTQQSMEPNAAHFRMIAQAFAAETSLPLRSLGVVGDNPESADAIAEANKELELEIRHWQKSCLTPVLRRLMTSALRIIDDTPAARDVYRRMAPHWQRPDTVSLAAATDAVVKLDTVAPGFGQSEVGLEMAGLEPDQIARFRVEQARLRGQATIEALIASNPPAAIDGAVEG